MVNKTKILSYLDEEIMNKTINLNLLKIQTYKIY